MSDASELPKFVTTRFFLMAPNSCHHFSSRKKMNLDNLFYYTDSMPKIPKRGTCLRYVEYDVYHVMSAAPSDVPPLTFNMAMHEQKMCCKNTRECAHKIRNGECTDKYIARYIGQKFWPQKYAQKTK